MEQPSDVGDSDQRRFNFSHRTNVEQGRLSNWIKIASPRSKSLLEFSTRTLLILSMGVVLLLGAFPGRLHADQLDDIRRRGELVYGADEEGGAPFLYRGSSKDDNDTLIGFEVDLMDRIGRALQVKPTFKNVQWDSLLSVLDRGDVDLVINGYELTPLRSSRYLPTRPYFVYQVQLIAHRDRALRCWADVQMLRPDGARWKIGVLGGTAAESLARNTGGPHVEVVVFDATTTALMATKNGQIDGTIQDLAPSRFFVQRPEFEDLTLAGPPEGCGYYVIYLRKQERALQAEIDKVIDELASSGELRRIYEKYGVWNEAQNVLLNWKRDTAQSSGTRQVGFNSGLLWRFAPLLLQAAGMTVFLACTAMPLAIALGLSIALGRLYGPRLLSWLLTGYVELIRGTPLMLQLYVLFYLLPELNIFLPAIVAGIAGLAINYSAYEAEIYRAGLQAIPPGQMEASLALGLSRGQAIRRVIIPQAVRIVIPPVTNDFIALFKDTSVCSVITLIELTKQYSILYNSYGGVVEFGLAAAILYMAMSLPLSWFSRWMERRLEQGGGAGDQERIAARAAAPKGGLT